MVKKGPSRKSESSKRVVKDASRRRAKKDQKGSGPTLLRADDMSVDVDVQTIAGTSEAPKLPAAADGNHFFSAPFTTTGARGVDKLHRTCKLCKDRTISDLSTNRRHLTTYHTPQYHACTTKNNFESRLEADVKPRKAAAEEFPTRALEHPKFKAMINVASRATDGVKIPRGKVKAGFLNSAHASIIKLNYAPRSWLEHPEGESPYDILHANIYAQLANNPNDPDHTLKLTMLGASYAQPK
ncbi:hypothetical protein B0H13DRAFT_1859380 [Mycena leptocephala]|nr:hypothetical protein B0H13DRAFT_1859380 [Mycena leptocephala]